MGARIERGVNANAWTIEYPDGTMHWIYFHERVLRKFGVKETVIQRFGQRMLWESQWMNFGIIQPTLDRIVEYVRSEARKIEG